MVCLSQQKSEYYYILFWLHAKKQAQFSFIFAMQARMRGFRRKIARHVRRKASRAETKRKL